MSSYGTFPQYNNQVDEHDKIGNITSNTNGILISTFSDNSFLIVNTNSDSSNTINFNDLSNYCYFDYDYNNWAKASNVSFKYSENNNNCIQ